MSQELTSAAGTERTSTHQAPGVTADDLAEFIASAPAVIRELLASREEWSSGPNSALVLACNHCGHMPSIDVRLGELCTACGIGGFTVSKRAPLSSSGSPASPLSEEALRVAFLAGVEDAVGPERCGAEYDAPSREYARRAVARLSASAPSPEDKGSDNG